MPDPASGIAADLQRLGREPTPDHWRRVVESAWPVLAAACQRTARGHADDALQEALLRVRDGASSFRPRGPDADDDARGWLQRVATTSALVLLRRERRVRARAVRAVPPRPPFPAAEDATYHADDLALLHAELAELRAPDRLAVALHHLQGQDLDQVAGAIGGTPEAARKRIARALETLRTRLARRGLVLGLAALVGGLQRSAAAEAPLPPIPAAARDLLTGNPAATTWTTTTGALMATAAACATALLIAVAAWHHGRGMEPAPLPPAAVPPPPATATPAALDWLDQPLPPRPTPPVLAIERVAAQLAADTGHPIFAEAALFLHPRPAAETFRLADATPRAALDRWCAADGFAWLEVEGQVLIADPRDIATLRRPLAPPAPRADGTRWPPAGMIGELLKALLANHPEAPSPPPPASMLTPEFTARIAAAVAAGEQQRAATPHEPLAAGAWTAPLPAITALSLVARANHWEVLLVPSEQGMALLTGPAAAGRPLLEPRATTVVIRGRPWTPSPLDQAVDLDLAGTTGAAAVAELSRRTGVAITWSGGDQTVTMKCSRMPLGEELRFIATLTGTLLTEPEEGRRLEFLPLARN